MRSKSEWKRKKYKKEDVVDLDRRKRISRKKKKNYFVAKNICVHIFKMKNILRY